MPPRYEVRAKDRIRKWLPKYVEVLQQASQRGISEEDTSTIVQSMLVDLLGYDRFREITGQYAVRGRWADWAVRVDDSLHFFVEVKPLGAKLREKDLFQVVSYSRQHNLEWAVLTTADVWQCHFVGTGQEPEEFFEVRLLDPNQAQDEQVHRLYLLTKEGCCRQVLQEEWVQSQCFRPERLGRLLLSDPVLAAVRRELHRESPGRRVDVGCLREAFARGVIRGDLYDQVTQASDVQGERRPRRKRTAITADGQTGAQSPSDDSEKRQQAGRKAAETRRRRRESEGHATTGETAAQEPKDSGSE